MMDIAEKTADTGATKPLSTENDGVGVVDGLIRKFSNVVNTLFPPEKRAELWERFKTFAISNPKITAFLLANIVLSGPPLLLFIVFTTTVFIVSVVAALLIGLIAAVLFTVFMVLVALFVILPTVFLTTLGATFLFLWGLGGYYILKWFNEGDSPAEVGNAIGDKLNALTGGRLGWLMKSARNPKQNAGVPEKESLKVDKADGLSAKKFSSPQA